MPPNVSSGATDKLGLRNEKGKLEILYNGNFYDVTDFVRRHPGGSVTNFYTARGEDAKQAIQQFHHRSMNRVESILKPFKKRPTEAHERKDI